MDPAGRRWYFCDTMTTGSPTAPPGDGIYADGSELTWILRAGGGQFPSRLRILESGRFPIPAARRFEHPSPAFDRLFLFRRGGCRVRAGGRARELEAGRAWLLPIGMSFSVDYRAGSLLHFFHLRVDDGLGGDVFAGQDGIAVVDAPIERCIAAWNAGGIAGAARWQGELVALVAALVAPRLPALVERRSRAGRWQALIDRVRARPSAGLGIAALARGEGLSRAALSKGFRRALGVPLKAFLIDAVMQEARRRLADGDDTVTAIAAGLGFSDTYYFCRAFRRATAVTPLAYRRAARMRLG